MIFNFLRLIYPGLSSEPVIWESIFNNNNNNSNLLYALIQYLKLTIHKVKVIM